MSIHYRFKSNIDFTTIPVPGRTMRLLDLKYAIVEINKLEKGMDFDLIVTNADTNEIYRDDKFHVPRNTRVVVKRAPAGPNGGIIQQMNLIKMKDKKDSMLRHEVLGSTIPSNTGMSLGNEFSSKTSSSVSEKKDNGKKEKKYDPRMMDSSDEEEEGDEDRDDNNNGDLKNGGENNGDNDEEEDEEAKLLAELNKQQEEEAAD